MESNGVRQEQLPPTGVTRKSREQRPGGPAGFIDVPLADKELPLSLQPVKAWRAIDTTHQKAVALKKNSGRCQWPQRLAAVGTRREMGDAGLEQSAAYPKNPSGGSETGAESGAVGAVTPAPPSVPDPQLAAIVDAWPTLSAEVRDRILALASGQI